MSGIKTKAYQLRGVQSWTKVVLLKQLVEPEAKVLDIYCGDGIDIGKWQRAGIKYYVTVDTDPQALQRASKAWEAKRKPFSAHFIHCDPIEMKFNEELKENYFDIVACFDKMDQNFTSEETALKFLRNVSKSLHVDGYFIGYTIDSSAVWYKAQKVLMSSKDSSESSGITIKGDAQMFTLHIHSSNFQKFGTQFTMSILGEEHSTTSYLIHFPSFIRIAKECGFNVICITNLKEFLEDNMKLYYSDLLAFSVFKKTISKKSQKPKLEKKIQPAQMDLISLFTIFILKKIR